MNNLKEPSVVFVHIVIFQQKKLKVFKNILCKIIFYGLLAAIVARHLRNENHLYS